MITLQEIVTDLDSRMPERVETGRQKIANVRQLAKWARNNHRTNLLSEEIISQSMLTLPQIIKDFIKETGCALRIDDFGIIKVRYREGKLSLMLRVDKALYDDMSNCTCQIDRYWLKPDGTKVRLGGRMAKPKELGKSD